MIACGGDGGKDVSTETTDTASTGPTGTTQSTGTTGTATTSTTPLTRCEALPVSGMPSVTLTPADGVKGIQAALDAASSGDVIGLEDGTYSLDRQTLVVRTEGVTLAGISGNAEAVIFDANLGSTVGIRMQASNTTLRGLTLIDPFFEGVVVEPAEEDAVDLTGIVVDRVHVINPGRIGILAQSNVSGLQFVEDGVVSCSEVSLTAEGRARFPTNCPVGGIQVRRARGWTLSDNHVWDLWCADAMADVAIGAREGSRDTVIERNLVEDCAQGVSLGVPDGVEGRTWPDADCPKGTVQHVGGGVRNNAIGAVHMEVHVSDAGFFTGLALVDACDVKALHNTVFSVEPPSGSALWLQGATSTGVLANILSSHGLLRRDDALIGVEQVMEDVQGNAFVYPQEGDFHLSPGAAVGIDEGVTDYAEWCQDDWDGQARDGAPDLGADEQI